MDWKNIFHSSFRGHTGVRTISAKCDNMKSCFSPPGYHNNKILPFSISDIPSVYFSLTPDERPCKVKGNLRIPFMKLLWNLISTFWHLYHHFIMIPYSSRRQLISLSLKRPFIWFTITFMLVRAFGPPSDVKHMNYKFPLRVQKVTRIPRGYSEVLYLLADQFLYS